MKVQILSGSVELSRVCVFTVEVELLLGHKVVFALALTIKVVLLGALSVDAKFVIPWVWNITGLGKA